MTRLKSLFENNKSWAKSIKQQDPQFFAKLARLQAPKYLWIGCADSRVPANEITGLLPGEMLVHRNVANLVVHTDLNCLSVIQFAVEVLNVEDIIVCGHYGCGGVKAALESSRLGLISNWLKHIEDIKHKHRAALGRLKPKAQKFARLCELNVLEQAHNVCQTTILQDAWTKKKKVNVHAWIYDIHDGLIKELWVNTTKASR